MKLIKPSEISSKIMTLLEESDEFVLLVSPYVKISKWYKLLKKLEAAKQRNIDIELIIRDDQTNHNSFKELNDLGLKYSSIKDLHCKLYLNEKYAIVSSMNLLLSSEINSIEIGYQTENEKEYNELKEFCTRHLFYEFNKTKTSESKFNVDWRDFLIQTLSEKLQRDVRIQHNDEGFQLNTGTNNYSVFIYNSKQNKLRISGILSGKEFQELNTNPSILIPIEELNIEFQQGSNGYYDTIWGTSVNTLKSQNLHEILGGEESEIANAIINFVLSVDSFKKLYRVSCK
ncbi:phospholipase D-like domain-containing protein [Labilibaculum antarcticum]|uniref:Phospholipase D-like domain-containing protein n=1 Tax=Labilibaculum antarcticum TaxID=1717717 RepID=A0A1Y1CT59_9BACT|nr:phospholipase D-like domain-containing protein [Labilibaculum antarcticum]BAX82441.1 hypothetical protein ALGA_4150 [Labilibaculum antarcticum]